MSTARRRSAWTASSPVSASRRAVCSVIPLAASSACAMARVPLPSGPMASRRPRRSRRFGRAGGPPGEDPERLEVEAPQRSELLRGGAAAGSALHEGEVHAARRILQQPDVLDGAGGLAHVERDALAGEPGAVLLRETVVGTVGTAGRDDDPARRCRLHPLEGDDEGDQGRDHRRAHHRELLSPRPRAPGHATVSLRRVRRALTLAPPTSTAAGRRLRTAADARCRSSRRGERRAASRRPQHPPPRPRG